MAKFSSGKEHFNLNKEENQFCIINVKVENYSWMVK